MEVLYDNWRWEDDVHLVLHLDLECLLNYVVQDRLLVAEELLLKIFLEELPEVLLVVDLPKVLLEELL